MHGKGEGECRRQYRNLHMRTVPKRVGVAHGADGSLSSLASPSPSFFCKDGRKISVGECALFKPTENSPPFIGIVCSLTANKENNLTLSVNWLYRSTEVKLGKGILLEAAPNEVFYSFRRNAIPAASLLHPCKVAFLPKGVDLPPGISAFVCRRVYDIETSRLCWLTDKNDLNEQQEEINQLLQKTQAEMHALAQPNGRSPKQMSGPMSTAQSKPRSDPVQNTVSQGKGKKRERGNHSSDAVERERYVKLEDGDPDLLKSESSLKSEIAKVTEKGPLVDAEGVERLVQVMFCEKNEKKADLSARSMLTGVIAGTDKLECLRSFVGLRGLSVLDDWLQDIHKAKIGDGSGLKDNEKSVEEFLLLVLRSLEKLPVNLQALQLCNIGKSVNHLRTHKSLEIQRKARSLVDTWKKRVAAEMNISDTRPSSTQAVSWSGKSRVPEVSHCNKQAGGSSEFGPKSHIVQPSSNKTAPTKLGHGETDPAFGSPGSTKLAVSHVSNFKDGQLKHTITTATSDLPSTTSRDEKSSGSSPSHNDSQSCSSDLAKAGSVSIKEDARSSTAGSSKLSSGSCRSKKSINGFPGSAGLESGPGRTGPLQKNDALDKACQAGLTAEKAADVSGEGNGNDHKLIVKIPNRGCSPAQAATEVSPYEISVMNSRDSSPSHAERPDQPGVAMEEKVDVCQASVNSDANSDSWQSNDFRDLLTACDDDGDSSDAVGDKDKDLKTDENPSKMLDVLRNAGKFSEASLSSMNALIESCINFASTNNPPVSIGDDAGMNLLASVAAGEMFKAEMKSPDESPKRNLASAEQDYAENDSAMKSSPPTLQNSLLKNTDGFVPSSDKGDCRISTLCPETLPEEKKELNSSSMDMETVAEPKAGNGMAVGTPAAVSAANNVVKNEIYGGKQLIEQNGLNLHGFPGAKDRPDCLLSVKNTCSNDIHILKAEEGAGEVVSASGAVEQKPSERILAETIEKEVDNIDKLNMKRLRERDFLSNGKQNELKSDKQNSETSECRLPGAGSKAVQTEQCSSTPTLAAARRGLGTSVRLEFDLNEGIEADDTKFGEPMSYSAPNLTTVPLISPLPPAASSHNAGLPAPIAVAASVKGTFIPPNDLLKAKVELGGWKGSAATSAFRPAEPRKIVEKLVGMYTTNCSSSSVKRNRPPLDFDLNAPGERIIEGAAPEHSVLQMSSLYSNCRTNSQREITGSTRHTGSIGLGLDLNQIGEATDVGNFVVGNGHRLDASLLAMKPSGNHANDVGVGGRRDFDLNDDALGAEPSTSSQHVKTSVLLQHTVQGLRMNGADMGNFSAWFQPGATYPAVCIPSMLSERGEQQQPYHFVASSGGHHPRMLGPSSGGISFNPDMYRGSLLSSSPAVTFPSSPFQYSVFPYGTSFALPSASLSGSATTYVDPSSGGRVCFPHHSQLLGPSSGVTAAPPFPRPYVVSTMASPFSDGSSSNSGVESSKKWSGRRVGLDLNTGPGGGGGDVEGRDGTSPLLSRQLQQSQALAEEQARMYQVSGGGGIMKRKEPDGGWESCYRQQSWQQ